MKNQVPVVPPGVESWRGCSDVWGTGGIRKCRAGYFHVARNILPALGNNFRFRPLGLKDEMDTVSLHILFFFPNEQPGGMSSDTAVLARKTDKTDTCLSP